MADTIEVYRRIVAAAGRERGIRLTADEVLAILKDGAIHDAVAAANEEEEQKQNLTD